MSKSRFDSTQDFQCNTKTLRRGDIIGRLHACACMCSFLPLLRAEVEGYVGKTQTGELSMFANKVWIDFFECLCEHLIFNTSLFRSGLWRHVLQTCLKC